MPIISRTNETDPDGVVFHDGAGLCRFDTVSSKCVDHQGPRRGFYKKTFVGKCLFETENNTYHDSDFFMTVWDDKIDAPRRINFATTRAACSLELGSHPDATPEIVEKYRLYCEKVNRRNRIMSLRAKSKQKWKDIRDMNINLEYYIKLRYAYPNEQDYQRVLKLLKSKKLRSDFRISLRDQILRWLGSETVYATPLSRNQFKWV